MPRTRQQQYREGGFDFVIFDPNTAAATALLDEKIGYVLTLPSDLSDNEMRTLESFQLDAIDVGALVRPADRAPPDRTAPHLRR